MLNENEVVRAMERFLDGDGYEVVKTCSTAERGVDIVARHRASGRELDIEAKGGTSARAGSARFETGFSRNQVRAHVAKAFFAAAAGLQKRPHAEQAVAFPRLDHHVEFVGTLDLALARLGIVVFWVHHDGTVSRHVNSRSSPP